MPTVKAAEEVLANPKLIHHQQLIRNYKSLLAGHGENAKVVKQHNIFERRS